MLLQLIFSFFVYNSSCLEQHKTVVSKTSEKEQVNIHCISLKKEQTAFIRLDQPDEAFLVDIHLPDGTLHQRHMSTNFLMGESMIEIFAPIEGNYELRVKSIYHPKSGVNNYSLTLIKRLTPAEIIAENREIENSSVLTNLKKHFHKVRSASVDDEDYSDLTGLKKAIGNRRVVFLGEATHNDGTTYKMKARLIKFLNQEMGFNILAFESGMYEIFHHYDLLKQNKSTQLKHAIYPVMTKTEEFQDTLHLLNRTDLKTPLNLWGIDMQFTKPYGIEFPNVLRDIISDKPFFKVQEFDNLLKVFKTLNLPNYRKKTTIPSDVEIDMFYKTVDTYISELSQYNNQSEKDRIFVQTLKSLKVHAQRFLDPKLTRLSSKELRDKQMAENLYWLAMDLKPNSKIIVWCATAHSLRPYKRLRNVKKMLTSHKKLGDFIYEKMGNQIYSIGFVSYEGEFGWDSEKADMGHWWGGYQIKKNQVEAIELEEYLSFIDSDYGFIDLRTANFDWIKQPQYARLKGHYPDLAIWPDVLDGLIYIKSMEIAHKVK